MGDLEENTDLNQMSKSFTGHRGTDTEVFGFGVETSINFEIGKVNIKSTQRLINAEKLDTRIDKKFYTMVELIDYAKKLLDDQNEDN